MPMHWRDIFHLYKHAGSEYTKLYLSSTNSSHFALSTSPPPSPRSSAESQSSQGRGTMYSVRPHDSFAIGGVINPKISIYHGLGPDDGSAIVTVEHHNFVSDKIVFHRHGKGSGGSTSVSVSKWLDTPMLRSFPAKFKHGGHEYVWNKRKVMEIPTERKGEDEDGMFVLEAILPDSASNPTTNPPHLASFHPQLVHIQDGRTLREPSYLSIHSSLLHFIATAESRSESQSEIEQQPISLLDAVILSYVLLKSKMASSTPGGVGGITLSESDRKAVMTMPAMATSSNANASAILFVK